jgi:16S rRNA (guanine966-N2)-methyltransferase
MVKPSKSFARPTAAGNGVLRIIGGRWRGRKLRFPALPGLRPSPDRVRETLFNWLAPALPGARCLDLFAGSGALGLEALSRDAAACTFVDSAAAACRSIGEHLALLQCAAGAVVNADVQRWLQRGPGASPPFDIVFLDPPFRREWLGPCCALLEQQSWLAPQAWIYLEAGSDEALPALPPNWQPHRDKHAGQVAYRLYRREAGALSSPA